MFTKKQLKEAMRKAHYRALHCDKLEYRVVWLPYDGDKLEVQEYVANSIWCRSGEYILKVYTTSPSIYDWIPEGKADAVAINQLQGDYIRNDLDNDVEEVYNCLVEDMAEAYRKMKERNTLC